MKKLILLLAVMLMTAPAMAAVTITVTDSDDGWAVISYDANGAGANFIRAFALDITASNDVNIVDYDSVTEYWVHPGQIDINDAGEVNDAGSPIAGPGYPGTLSGIDTNAVTIEMGALFEAGGPGDPPAASGVLLRLQLDPNAAADAAEICVVGNAIRGNIVMKDASSEDPAQACAVVEVVPGGPTCPCLGDICDTATTGGPDGKVDYGDWSMLSYNMMNFGTGAYYEIPIAGFECMDLCDTATTGGPDGKIDYGDWSMLSYNMMNFGTGAYYEVPCF